MKNFIKKPIPKTESLLNFYNLELDKYDGVVSLANKNTTNNYGQISITYREVAFVIYYDHGTLSFNYNSSKSGAMFNTKNMKKQKPEDWFEIFEKIVISLAEELEIKEIKVNSGRNDSKFLIEKGYTKGKKYQFHK